VADSNQQNTEPAAAQTAEVVSKAEYEQVKSQMQNWMAKATHYEKTYGGVDLEALRAKAEERDILAQQMAVKSGKPEDVAAEIERARREAAKEFGTKYESEKQRASTLEGQLKRLQVIQPAMLEAAKRFTDTELDLVQMLIEKDLDLDGEKVIVKGKDGPRLSKAKAGEYMDLNEYLDDLAEKYPNLAKATNVPGARNGNPNMGRTNGANGNVPSLQQLSMTPDKGKAVLEKLARENPQALTAMLKGVSI
jgi:hypothetical protein